MSNNFYKIILPIPTNNLFDFDFKETNDPNIIIKIHDIITKQNIDPDAIKKFIKRNNDHKMISMMLSLVSFSVFYDFYYEYEFMQYYWSENILKKLFERNIKNLLMKYYNEDNYVGELIQLTGRFNMIYNYTLNILHKRRYEIENIYFKKFEDKFKINLGQYYGDNLFVELLGNNSLFKSFIEKKREWVIILFPKYDKIIKSYNQTDFVKINEICYIVEKLDNLYVMI